MKKTALLLLITILVFGSLVLASEETKVPFSAVKSSCYGQIDMSKAEFLLSEIGKECVSDAWLEDNLDEEETQEEKTQVANYEIIRKEEVPATYDGVEAKRISYRVVVGKEIERKQIRPTVEKIVSDIHEEDEEIDSIHLLLYSTEDRIEGAYDIAMAQWAPGGELANLTGRIIKENIREDYEIDLEIRDNLDEYLQRIRNTGERFNLSEEERKEIYKELVRCEDKAYEESRKYYDPQCSSCPEYQGEEGGGYEKWSGKRYEKEQELIRACEKKIRKEYEISKEQQEEISSEAFTKDWPMPELPPEPDCCN